MALQMSWQASLLHHKRKTGPPLGLKNLGNSCYLNSVLQCLTYTPPLANFCLKNQHSSLCDSSNDAADRKRDCPFCILEKRIVRSLSMDLTLDAPSKIQSCLRIFAEHFRCGRQEDAHEFLRYVIDACHNTCLRLKKLQQQRRKGGVLNGSGSGNEFGSSSTVVKDIFGGALQSQVKCLSCGNESNKVDEIMDISLDVLHSSSLKEAIQKFFQPEDLDGSNKYKCENCKKLVKARKQMSILQAPNVLVIQLKRFEGIFGGKIDKSIAFEEVLVLSSFMCKASQDPHPEYNLFGTIVHSGFSPESGHYYAYVKDAIGRWYCCNDSYVTLSTLHEVLSEKVYVLFFSRTKQRPVSSSSDLSSNGVKFCDSNGISKSKGPKTALPQKAEHARSYAENLSRKDISTNSKVDKRPCSPHSKLNSPGNTCSGRFSPTVNGKINVDKNQFLERNGNVKKSICTEKIGNDIIRNGPNKSKNVAVDNDNSQPVSKANQNGKIQRNGVKLVKEDLRKANGMSSRVPPGRGPDCHESHNGNGSSDISGSKRKLQDKDSILLAKDGHSQAKLEELKEVLGKEVSLVLQSCGWSDKVYSFMCSRKRLCAQEAGISQSSNDELKKLLITDAKATFLSQIPESLKENLIERLRTFSQEKH